MVQVKVSEGILEGEEIVNWFDEIGKTFFSFKGIPYAEPPLGNLRFKAPQPSKPWSGIRSAKTHGPICYQYDMFHHFPPRGSEDCLYLNVYTPSLSPPEPLPVMFFIHGGGFVSGSGDDSWYGPEYLLKKDVVLVTINYRLEILGFLCLDTEDVPGNATMKDQVAALRWVNKNIHSFGGDPNNITIFGESAGGAFVGFHLISPMTKGLFKKAILQSGTHNCWWSQVTDAKEKAMALARRLGYRLENDEGLYDFFKEQPVESLIMHQTNTPLTYAQKEKTYYDPSFVVVDEKKFGDNERYYYGEFNYNNFAKIHEGVEVFLGFTTDEGLINLTVGSELEKKFNQINYFMEEFVPKRLVSRCSISEQLQVGRIMKEFYFKKSHIDINNWQNLVRFNSAFFYHYDMIQLAKMIAQRKKNKVHMYTFSCISKRNQFVKYLGLETLVKDKPVVCHCDDLLYLFSGKEFHQDYSSDPEVLQLIDKVTTIWTNIAKSGNPTPDATLGAVWPEFSLDSQEFLDIGNQLSVGSFPHREEMQFWEGIFRKYAPDFVVHC